MWTPFLDQSFWWYAKWYYQWIYILLTTVNPYRILLFLEQFFNKNEASSIINKCSIQFAILLKFLFVFLVFWFTYAVCHISLAGKSAFDSKKLMCMFNENEIMLSGILAFVLSQADEKRWPHPNLRPLQGDAEHYRHHSAVVAVH